MRIVLVWVALWSAALPHTCYRRWLNDLTPIIAGLSGWVDTRTWVTSQGVSSAPMGERHQRPVSGEVEMDDAIFGARMRRRCRHMSKTPGLRPRANQGCFETP
jgi:hypothetical protein